MFINYIACDIIYKLIMLTTFKQFLINKERIPEKNIPYYLKWVSDCYRFFNVSETHLLTNNQRSQFLTHLVKKHENWQVEQADRAIRLYGYFLSKMRKSEDLPETDFFMWTRRTLLRTWFWASLSSLVFHPLSISWAKTKQLLPKGFSKSQLKDMNPAEIDNRNLEVDSLDQFGTMGPTDVATDLKTYRLKVTGNVERPLSLSYDQILKYPSLTEAVLLICPGFFANNGRWTGVNLKSLIQETQIHKEAQYIDVVGAHEKRVRIPLKAVDKKKIFLAYRVNNETLPQKHGFPLRLVYEDAYGSDWVKYVDEIVIS